MTEAQFWFGVGLALAMFAASMFNRALFVALVLVLPSAAQAQLTNTVVLMSGTNPILPVWVTAGPPPPGNFMAGNPLTGQPLQSYAPTRIILEPGRGGVGDTNVWRRYNSGWPGFWEPLSLLGQAQAQAYFSPDGRWIGNGTANAPQGTFVWPGMAGGGSSTNSFAWTFSTNFPWLPGDIFQIVDLSNGGNIVASVTNVAGGAITWTGEVLATNGQVFGLSYKGVVQMTNVFGTATTNRASAGMPVSGGGLSWSSSTNIEGGLINLAYDTTYAETGWRVVTESGQVVASGTASNTGAALSAASARAALLPGVTGSVQINPPTGYNEMGGASGYAGWQSTGQTVTGNGPPANVNLTARPPATPPPSATPFPTPAMPTPTPAAPTPTPVPTAPATNDVSLNVQPYVPGSLEMGESSVVSAAQGIQGQINQIMANLSGASDTLGRIVAEFSKIKLTSPGSNCVFQFGSVQVDLSPAQSWGLRDGIKAFLLILAIVAAVGMVRDLFVS